MKCVYAGLIVVWLALGSACRQKVEQPVSKPKPVEPKPEILFRHHFIGAQLLGASTNAARLKAIGELAETQKLLDRSLQKLAAAPYQFLQPRLDAAATDGAAWLRPLLDDMAQAESFSVVAAREMQPAEWSLAIRLSDERASLWKTNLIQLLQAWQLGTPTQAGTNAPARWELSLTDSIGKFQIIQVAGGLLLGVARTQLPEESSLLKRLAPADSAEREVAADWLEVEAKTAWLAEKLTLPDWMQGPPAQWPLAQVRLSSKGEGVRSLARLVYREPLALSLPAWQIPTNTVRDPLLSFTVARGVSRWLGKWDAISKLQLPPLADQIVVWAESQFPFLTFVAMPAPEATNFVELAANNLSLLVGSNQEQRVIGKFLFDTNLSELRWQVPFFSPWLRALEEPSGRFVMGGLFPYAPSRRPAPAELLDQVFGRTNLIYFDWEITQGRLQQWRQLGQLPALLTYEQLPDGRRRHRSGKLAVAGDTWFEYVGSHQKIGYIMRHGIAPNGGGKLVNQYTLIMDVLVDTNGAPAASLLQIHSPGNHQEGDLFWQDDNFGDERDGFKGMGTFTAGAWHRVAIAVDLAAKPPTVVKFVDGIKQDDWPQKRLDQPNRALRDFAILFGAGDLDDYRTCYVNSVQVRSGKMTDADLAALGGPKAGGIPNPGQGVSGQWDFDEGDLRATTGRPLEFFDGTNGVCATKTKFASTTQLGIPNIDGEPAQVIVVPGDHLGNAATEITQTAPNEIQFLRNSDLGFTAFELVALLNWLENPAWPLFGRQLAAPPNPAPVQDGGEQLIPPC